MEELEKIISENLKNLDVRSKKLKNEKDFEDYTYNMLDTLLKGYNRSLLLKRQITSNREGRQLKPDIIIGYNDILIELKYNVAGLNDIYRLFYQAFKYSKLAKKLLILYVYDPNKEMTNDDITDLESFEKVKVIRKL